MKLITWNTNGLRAALDKGVGSSIANSGADIVAIQETKLNTPIDTTIRGYLADWNHAKRQGYSGTLCLFKKKPLAIAHGIGDDRFDADGRTITLEYPAFIFVNVYVPNSQGGLAKWYYRLDWDEAFCEFAAALNKRKPVIIGGDFNVAHEVIDTYRTEPTAGFREEERGGFDNLLSCGFVDAFRLLHPGTANAYTWWSGKNGNHEANRGRRLDYFLVSESIASKVKAASILSDVQGSDWQSVSDHAPVMLEVSL